MTKTSVVKAKKVLAFDGPMAMKEVQDRVDLFLRARPSGWKPPSVQRPFPTPSQVLAYSRGPVTVNGVVIKGDGSTYLQIDEDLFVREDRVEEVLLPSLMNRVDELREEGFKPIFLSETLVHMRR